MKNKFGTKLFSVFQILAILLALVSIFLLATFGQKKEIKPFAEVKVEVQEEVKETPVASPSASPKGEILPKSTQPVVNDPILVLLNKERKAKGLKELTESGKYSRGASMRAKELVEKGQWSHDGINEAFARAGFNMKYNYSENLARDYSNPQDIINAWLNSPVHNKVMMNSRCTYAGIGRYANYTVLWLGVCGI